MSLTAHQHSPPNFAVAVLVPVETHVCGPFIKDHVSGVGLLHPSGKRFKLGFEGLGNILTKHSAGESGPRGPINR